MAYEYHFWPRIWKMERGGITQEIQKSEEMKNRWAFAAHKVIDLKTGTILKNAGPDPYPENESEGPHDLSTQEVLARADADEVERLKETSDEEKDLSDLLSEFIDQEKLWHFEGDSGLAKFEKICTAIGYPGHQFRYGDPIQHFLSDNPGAMQAILEWIEEQNSPEWKESIISHLKEKEE